MEKEFYPVFAKDWLRGDGRQEEEKSIIEPTVYSQELHQMRQGSCLTRLGLIGLGAGSAILLARFLPYGV